MPGCFDVSHSVIIPCGFNGVISATKDGKIPEGVSLDLIAKIAGRITEMGEHLLPKRKRKGKESDDD